MIYSSLCIENFNPISLLDLGIVWPRFWFEYHWTSLVCLLLAVVPRVQLPSGRPDYDARRSVSHTQSKFSLPTIQRALPRALLQAMGQAMPKRAKNKKQKARFQDDDSKSTFTSITLKGLGRATPRRPYLVFVCVADLVHS